MVTIPIIRISEYDILEISSPEGLRNIPGGSFAFKQLIASGCMSANPLQPATTSGTLIFDNVKFEVTDNAPPSHLESKLSVLTINLGSSGTAISDMAIYLTEDTALKASTSFGLEPAFVQFTASGTWQHNAILPSGAGTRLSRDIPIQRNILRQDGGNALLAEDDANSSQFIYMNVVVPFGYPLGTFGICGSGNLRFGLIFNYWNDEYLLNFG